MANQITKRAVDAAKPGDQEYFVWDRELLGFGLRVLPSGVKSYVAKYRLGPGRRAPVRRVTIGKHGKVTADAAREAARKILANVVHGGDPAGDRARQRRELTVGELAYRYIAEHVRVHNKPTTIIEFERLVNARIKPAFGSRRTRNSDTLRYKNVAHVFTSLALRGQPRAGRPAEDALTGREGMGIVGRQLRARRADVPRNRGASGLPPMTTLHGLASG